MEKIIKVEIRNSEIFQSSAFGGIQGEAETRALEITFDSDWDGLSKTITFFDAEMEKSVKILLNNLTLQKNGTHLVYIPAEPLASGGQLTYIIDGEKDGKVFRSVKKTLKVHYAPDTSSASEPESLTPDVVAQLNLAAEKNAEDISVLEEKATLQEEMLNKTNKSIEELAFETKETLEEKADKTTTENLQSQIHQALDTASAAYGLASDTANIELDKKADKTVIEEYGASDGDLSLGYLYNKEARFVGIAPDKLNFIIKDGVYEEDYIAGVSFVTNPIPPEVSYTNTGIVHWVGCDCSYVDGYSLFIPSGNMNYDIVFYFNGYKFIGLVNGYKTATGNAVSQQ